jgi:sugar/nucleoside kinase (ribokinase family)
MVSVDLSDPELIRRIHDVFRGVLRDYVNIVFVNEDEARAFTGRDEEGALEDLAGLCDVAVVKLGSRGSIIGSGRTVHRIEAFKTDVVNTNGAGDMYASGVLYGISRNAGLAACGRYGSYGSSLVVARVGARYPDPIPEERLKELS